MPCNANQAEVTYLAAVVFSEEVGSHQLVYAENDGPFKMGRCASIDAESSVFTKMQVFMVPPVILRHIMKRKDCLTAFAVRSSEEFGGYGFYYAEASRADVQTSLGNMLDYMYAVHMLYSTAARPSRGRR